MNHRRTRDIVIELTSLLDVVMILIFAVMIENTRLMKQQEAEAGAARLEAQTALEQLADVSARNEALISSRDELTAFYENELEALRNLSEQEKADLLADITELKDERETLSSENSELLSALEELQKKYEDQTEELLIALSKIDRMDIDELTARLQAAETAVKNYEYMEGVDVVIHVGLATEMIGNKFFNTITYSAGTGSNQASHNAIEYEPKGENREFNLEIAFMTRFLTDTVKTAFFESTGETRVFIFYSSNKDEVLSYSDEVMNSELDKFVDKIREELNIDPTKIKYQKIELSEK